MSEIVKKDEKRLQELEKTVENLANMHKTLEATI